MKIFRLLLSFLLFCSLLSCEESRTPPPDKLETHIREILTLPTYEHVYRDIIYVGEEATFLGITTAEKKLLFSIDVVVQAGIDLSKGIEIIPQQKNTVVVKLPAPEILLIDADENSINQYFVKERGKSVSRLEYYDEIDRQKVVIREDALKRNILVKAEENAKKLIAKFLSLAGFEEVIFKELESAEGDDNGPS
jgi:hypothetical protein